LSSSSSPSGRPPPLLPRARSSASTVAAPSRASSRVPIAAAPLCRLLHADRRGSPRLLHRGGGHRSLSLLPRELAAARGLGRGGEDRRRGAAATRTISEARTGVEWRRRRRLAAARASGGAERHRVATTRVGRQRAAAGGYDGHGGRGGREEGEDLVQGEGSGRR